jgi:hypothetical protein
MAATHEGQPEERKPLSIARGRKGDKRSALDLHVPDDGDFADDNWLPAPDVEQIAGRLCARHPERFAHFQDFTFSYFWKRKGGKANDKPKLGEAARVGGLTEAFAPNVDFAIWLAADNVREATLTNYQAEALVFRCMKRTGTDDKGRPAIKGFDWHGYSDEVTTYGLWMPELQDAGEAFLQLRLDVAQ